MRWSVLLLLSLGTTLVRSDEQNEVGVQIIKRQIDQKKVVCYYANWAVYRQGTAKFTPQNINPYLCTHLIYAFGGLTRDDTIQPFDEYQDLEKSGYSKFVGLKTYNRNLKTMIAIGGWNEGSKKFSPMVADPKRRNTFIKSAIRFLRQYNFDGIDLDWEYPTFRDGGKPEDRINYARLIIEMREAFESEADKSGKERLLISMAVPASLEYAGKGFEIAELDKHLDFFNLLTYDYHSSFEPSTNHHSPLFRPDGVTEFDFRSNLNIDATVKFYLKKGATRQKLVLGIPTYGRSYTLLNPDAHEIGSPTDGPGEQGKGTKEDGYLAYYEICEGIKDNNWDVVDFSPGRVGPYAYKGKFWVGYDDQDMVQEKAFYVVEEDLGGIMFWTIDNDDFRGYCHDKPFALIEAAKEALYGVQSTAIKTKTSVSVSTSEQTRVERIRLNQKQLAQLTSSGIGSEVESSTERKTTPSRPRPTQAPSAGRNFDPLNTPEPPTTPSSEPEFTCKDEGFFPHGSSCKKYYWCLDAPGGMVAHTFTCPTGLFFNTITDGCDFRRNVDCGEKDEKEEISKETTKNEPEEEDEEPEEDPRSLKEILDAIKNAGGLEAFEDNLEKEEEAKEQAEKKEEERRKQISEKTRNRLSKLLDRKRAEAAETLSKSPSIESSSQPPSSPSSSPEPIPETTSPSSRSRFFRNRNRFSLNRNRVTTTSTESPRNNEGRADTSGSVRIRSRFRNLLTRGRTTTTTTPVPEVTEQNEVLDEDTKVTIIGVPGLETESEAPATLRPNRFRPQAGVRDRVRNTLKEVLESDEELLDENAQVPDRFEVSTPFAAVQRQRVPPSTEAPVTERYVTISRGRGAQSTPLDDSDDGVLTNQVGDDIREVRLNRIRARVRKTRDTVSIVYPSPAADAADSSPSQGNPIPDLEQRQGVHYIFPFSTEVRRESRQTSSPIEILEEKTTPEAISYVEEEKEKDHQGHEEYDEDEWQIAKSVEKSLSEALVIATKPSIISSTEAIHLEESSTPEPERLDIVEVFPPSKQNELQSDNDHDVEDEEVTTILSVTSTVPPSSAPDSSSPRSLNSLFNNRRRQQHPFLASKRGSSTTTESTTSTTHPILAQKKQEVISATTSTEASYVSTTSGEKELLKNVSENEVVDENKETEENTEIDVETTTVIFTTQPDIETSTKGGVLNLLSQRKNQRPSLKTKIKERLLKEAEAKEEKNSLEETKPLSGSRFDLVGNRNSRPRFKLPKSLQSRLESSAIQPEESNELPDEEVTLQPPTTSRFRRPGLTRPFARPTSAPSPTRTTFARNTGRRLPSALTATEPSVQPSIFRSRLRSRSRLNKPFDLSASPSKTVGQIPQETTTLASISTTKLTVGDILASLHGEQTEAPEVSTLRPKAFKPKLGSRERAKLREKLHESLKAEVEENENTVGESLEITTNANPTTASLRQNVKPSTSQPSRTRSRLRTSVSRNIPREFPRSNSFRVRPNSLSSTSLDGPKQFSSRPRTRTRQRVRPNNVVEVSQPKEEDEVIPVGGRVLSEGDLMKTFGFGIEDVVQQPRVLESTTETIVVNEEGDSSDSLIKSIFQEAFENNDQEDTESPDPVTIPTGSPSIQDFLKSAVVESKTPPPTTKPPVAFVPTVIPQPGLEEPQQKPFRVIPQRPQATRGRVRSRARIQSRHRFADPAGTISSPKAEANSPRSTGPQQRRPSRVRSRQRVALAEPAVTEDTVVELENSSPVTVGSSSKPRIRTRGRAVLSRRRQRLQTRPSPAPQVDKVIEVEAAEVEEATPRRTVPISRVPFGTRRTNLRTSTRANTRLRVRGGGRSTTPAAPSDEQVISDDPVIVDQDSSLSEESRSSSLRSRSRFVGKSENQTETQTVVSSSSITEHNEEETSVVTESSVETTTATEEDPETQQTDFGTETTVTVPMLNESVEPTRQPPIQSVSPSSGIQAVPVSFFASTQKFTHFKSKEDTLTTPQSQRIDIRGVSGESLLLENLRQLNRVGRSTLRPPVTTTVKTFGVSGHTFSEEPETTTPLSNEFEGKPNNEEELIVSDKEKPKKKVSVRKSLFGRKRPNFLDSLGKRISKLEEREKITSDGNLSKSFFKKNDKSTGNSGSVTEEAIQTTESIFASTASSASSANNSRNSESATTYSSLSAIIRPKTKRKLDFWKKKRNPFSTKVNLNTTTTAPPGLSSPSSPTEATSANSSFVPTPVPLKGKSKSSDEKEKNQKLSLKNRLKNHLKNKLRFGSKKPLSNRLKRPLFLTPTPIPTPTSSSSSLHTSSEVPFTSSQPNPTEAIKDQVDLPQKQQRREVGQEKLQQLLRLAACRYDCQLSPPKNSQIEMRNFPVLRPERSGI